MYCLGGPDAGNLSCHGADEQRERRKGLSWKLLKSVKILVSFLPFCRSCFCYLGSLIFLDNVIVGVVVVVIVIAVDAGTDGMEAKWFLGS